MKTYRPRLLPALLAFALFTTTVLATTMRPKQVDCPVCEKEFTAMVISSTNTGGGIDLDLCPHAAGDEPRNYAVWTCPHCWFSAPGGSLERGISNELKKKILAELRPAVPVKEGSEQWNIPGWVKYGLAAKIAEWEEASPERLADLCLRAAWSCRSLRTALADESEYSKVDPYVGSIARKAMEQAMVDPGTGPKVIERTLLDLRAAEIIIENLPEKFPARALHAAAAAKLLRFRGENEKLAPLLTPLQSDPATTRDMKRWIELFLASCRRESEFQELFLTHWRRLAEGEDGLKAVDPALHYIAADTMRRLGRKKEAAETYLAVLQRTDAAGPISTLAEYGLGLVDGAGDSEDRLAEIRARSREAMLAKLTDPDTAKAAYRELRAVLDPEAIPGIVKALEHESGEVRAYAALTLKFYPDPGDQAIDALGRVLLSDAEDLPREQAADALACIASPRSREPLEKCLEKCLAAGDLNPGILGYLVQALGLAGEASSVPLLLAVEERAGWPPLWALSRLANREFKDSTAVATWWEQNKAGSRRDWVVAGFRAVGFAIDSVEDRKNIPLLIELLDDSRYWIRYNALRILREHSGERFGWKHFLYIHEKEWSQAQLATDIALWRRWWKEQQ